MTFLEKILFHAEKWQLNVLTHHFQSLLEQVFVTCSGELGLGVVDPLLLKRILRCAIDVVEDTEFSG